MSSEGWYTTPHRCGTLNCRTRRYRRDPADSHVYCRNGHQQPQALETEIEDLEEFTQSSQRKATRRVSSAAGTDSEGLSGTDSVKERTGRGIVYGREAVELYLQCLQSVLMREVWWAINQQGVMRELEGVVRGMWGQRLRMCEAWTMRELREDVNDAERRSFSSLGSGTEDRELVAEGRLPDLRDTLCLVYFGMVLLRLPVMVRDVLDWSRDDGFGFANTRTKLPWDAYRRLPLSLRNRFNVQSIDRTSGYLHHRTLVFSRMLLHPSPPDLPSIKPPDLNHILHLDRLITALSLPVTIFTGVESMNKILNVTYKFPSTVSGKLRIEAHPEIMLHALLVIVVKLTCPFDDIERSPSSKDDPASLSIDWKVWNERHTNLPRTGSSLPLLSRGQNRSHNQRSYWNTKPTDVVTMKDDQLDGYLDWFQKTLLHDSGIDDDMTRNVNEFDRDVFQLFPISSDSVLGRASRPDREAHMQVDIESYAGSEYVEENIKEVHRSLRPLRPVETSNEVSSVNTKIEGEGTTREPSEQNAIERRRPTARTERKGTSPLRPGEKYKRWKHVEDVEEAAIVFIERLAWLAGLDLESLIRSVRLMEARLIDWQQRIERYERKKKREGEEAVD